MILLLPYNPSSCRQPVLTEEEKDNQIRQLQALERKTQVLFSFAGKEHEMTKNKTKLNEDDVIMVTDEMGVQLYLSDRAANRLSWFLTGILGILTLPVIILAVVAG